MAPVCLMMLFGIIEFGFLFRNWLSLNNATVEGARAASVAGSDLDADFLVLRTIEHGVAALGLQNVEFVVVYRATGPKDSVPPACLTNPILDGGAGTSACNRYTPSDFFLPLLDNLGNPTGNFRCVDTNSVDHYWCPSDREAALSGNSGAGPDYVGIYIAARHDFITGFFGSGIDLSDEKIIRIEPERA